MLSGLFPTAPNRFHIRSDGLTLESVAQGTRFGHVCFRATIAAGRCAQTQTMNPLCLCVIVFKTHFKQPRNLCMSSWLFYNLLDRL